MASFRKRSGGWRAEIFVQGTRESGVFSTKAEASSWAAERESQLRRSDASGIVLGKTCLQAFERYRDEVSVYKKGARWETIRLTAIASHLVAGKKLGEYLIAEVTPDILGQWRDMRLKTVLGSTVNRDLNLISHVFTTARREWKWAAKSPTADVRHPTRPVRLISMCQMKAAMRLQAQPLRFFCPCLHLLTYASIKKPPDLQMSALPPKWGSQAEMWRVPMMPAANELPMTSLA